VLVSSDRAFAQFSAHTYDIRRYEITIRPDFSTGDLAIDSQIDLDNAAGAQAFRFGLSTQFGSVAATVNGRETAVQRTGGVIEIPAPARTRDVRLHVTTRGRSLKSDDEDRSVMDQDSLFLLWSDRFYPIDFADWAIVKISVLLPPGMAAIAAGTLTSTRATNEGVWHVFESARPAVQFSVFADRRWIRTERNAGGVKMVTLLHPDVQQFADTLFETSGDVIAYYTHLHGYYPADSFAFVTLSGMFARRAFAGFIGYEPRYLTQTMARDGYDGHETALLWWGYAAHGEGSGASQWTEGFGDYVEMLYAEERRKPVPYKLQRARDAFLAIAPTPDLALADLRGSSPQPLIHGRLPWVMAAVRERIGDAAFRRAIRTLFDRYRCRTFTLDQFISVFENAAKSEGRPAVRALFGRPGVRAPAPTARRPVANPASSSPLRRG
jgi:hypothetical protein